MGINKLSKTIELFIKYADDNIAISLPQLKGAVILPVEKPIYDPSPFANNDEIKELPIGKHHITLISVAALKPIRKLLEKQWGELIKNLPPTPIPKFDPTPREAKRENGKITWFLPIINQDEFKQYVQTIAAAIKQNFPEWDNPDANRFFHLSMANNRGGIKEESIGDINQGDL